ncbi:ribosomal protein S8 [Meredithblackwellia eburnea MCA 4105]
MLPHELCSRLTNASLARHRFVPLSPTNQHKSLLTLLYTHGFLTSLSYGSTDSSPSTPPSPSSFVESPVSQKRLWAQLKYRNDRPVLQKMALVSHPSKRIFMDRDEVKRFVQGARVKFVPGLRLGEVALIKSRMGWVEGREAVKLGLGGEVIARVG